MDPNAMRPKQMAAAQRALELDNNLAEAHLELANLARDAWDWKTAESEYRLTLQLNPSFSRARSRFSTFLCNLGRYDEAMTEAYRTKELDPEQLSSRAAVPETMLLSRRYDEAIAELQTFTQVAPDSFGIYWMLAMAYSAKGMHHEAIAAQIESLRLGNKMLSSEIYMGATYARAGEHKKAREILRRIERATDYVSPAELSVLYVSLGETEQAFATLEKAYTAHDLQLQHLNVDFSFDPIRSDPRFRDLVRRVGLPE
jgi:tetratricopeptide (TPR) repeat protein